MPLYFFHLRDGENVLLDKDGQDLSGIKDVASVALVEARAIIAEEARDGRILLDKYIDVENAYGAVVHRLPFADAVEIVPANK